MKKYLVLVAFLFPFTLTYSQTIEKEKENLNNQVQDGKIKQSEIKDVMMYWNELIQDMENYPEIPLDTNGDIDFTKVYHYDDSLSKEEIFNRCIEYNALAFKDVRSVTHYTNIETGKIIVKGYFDIYSTYDVQFLFWNIEGISKNKAWISFMYTIKDGKIKMEATHIEFDKYFNSSLIMDNISLKSLYPVTSFDRDKWKEHMSLLNETYSNIYVHFNNVNSYISNQTEDYNF